MEKVKAIQSLFGHDQPSARLIDKSWPARDQDREGCPLSSEPVVLTLIMSTNEVCGFAELQQVL